MAEIGTVAAAAQLAGYGIKAVMVCARLYQQLRDASQEVQCKTSNIRHAEALIRNIKGSLDSVGPGSVSSIISPGALKEANDLVQAWLIRAEYLSALLDGLTVAPRDAILKKGLKRARSLQIQGELDAQFEELDKLARTLDLWHSHQNIRFWQQQLSTSSTTQASLQTLQKQVEECNVSIQAMVQSLPQINRLNMELPVRHCVTINCILMLLSQERRMHWECAAVFEVRPALVRRETSSSVHSRSSINLTRIAANVPSEEPRTGLNVTLAFRSISGGLVFQLSPQIVATRIVDPKASPAFLSLAQMGENLCKATGKRSTGEDWWLSSLACQRPDGQYSEHIGRVQAVLRDIYHKLEYNFGAGLASARDEDENGSTLLHEFVRYISPVWYIQSEVYDTLASIVRLLISHGIEVNARTLYRPMKTYTALDACFFDAAGVEGFKSCHMLGLSKIDRLISSHGGEITRSKLGPGFPCEMRVILNNPDIGVEYGCSPLGLAVIRRSLAMVKQLVARGIEIDGRPDDPHSPLSFTLGWPEGMRFLLESGADPSTAIHSAVFFGNAAAVRMLLEYDCTIFRDYSAQYPPQSAWYSPFEGDPRKAPVDSVLEYSLWKYVYSNDSKRCPNNSSMPSIRRALVNYMAESRRKLAKLALLKIPRAELYKLGWDASETIIDKAAIPICKRLEQLGIKVPRSLKPGRYATAYHMRYLDTSTADCLYQAGFHDLDVEDDQGWTPLLLSCSGHRHKESLDSSDPLPSWYLDHSVIPRATAASSNGTTHLHLLAIRFRHHLRHPSPSAPDPQHRLRLSTTLARFCTSTPSTPLISPDRCRCPCSPSGGCLPPTLFLKRQPLSWPHKSDHLHALFSRSLAAGTPNPIRPFHFSAANVELFERLGLTHTCCGGGGKCNSVDDDDDDRSAIWDEESELIACLRDWMRLYAELEAEHCCAAAAEQQGDADGGSADVFWDAWWMAVGKFVPERPWVRSGQRGPGDRAAGWRRDGDVCDGWPGGEGQGGYGPDAVAVRAEVGFAVGELRRRRGEWEVFGGLGGDVFA
ncbi:ankyrin repeat protein [Diplodia corticola]|uniref:Ankyrin repeat protein n=1 Tax=Diplodia corticola TaxID=236234 RepID=A0A1J9SBQ1_9PEZI|nr:ankyrin repeat protein [Diplodia corticola]OJD37903.1 ankyrin repeat protein [Diplodia corticola]